MVLQQGGMARKKQVIRFCFVMTPQHAAEKPHLHLNNQTWNLHHFQICGSAKCTKTVKAHKGFQSSLQKGTK